MGIIIPIMKPPVSQAVTLKTGLLSCWEMAETSGAVAYDSHGSRNLTIISATVNQTGKLGQAFSYNGSSSQLDLSAANSAGLGNLSNMSISAWVNPATTGANYRMIAAKLHSSWSTPHYVFKLDLYPNGQPEFYVGNAAGFAGCNHTTVSVNVWTHLVGTYNGTTGQLKLYKNNVAGTPGTLSGAGNTGSASSPFIIGDDSDLYSGFQNWNGLIDQVAIWNRCLTANDVSTLYNSGNGLAYNNW